MTNMIQDYLLANFLIFCRIGSCAMFMPALGSARVPMQVRLLIVTGFLGGLTTFSTYSAEVVGLFERGQFGWALGVAFAHLAASFSLTAVGIWGYRALA